MLREYPLFWYEEAGDALDFALQAALAEFYPAPMATGENLFSHQDARNLLRYGGLRLAAVRLRAILRPVRVSSHPSGHPHSGMVAAPLHPSRRPPDVAEHRRRPGPRRQRELPRPLPAFRRVSRRRLRGERLRNHAGTPRDRVRRQVRIDWGYAATRGVD